MIHMHIQTLNIFPYASKNIFNSIFILQACAVCFETYFSKIDSLRSATTFVPRNFLLFIANNIISRWRSDIIVRVTEREKEWNANLF